jgi:thymidylate synthase
MNKIDKVYQQLLQDILDNGVEKKDRTGTGTLSVFGRQIHHKMSEGFPLLTTKKMAWKTMVTELIWFLSGSTNIKYLVMNGCNIWNGDAYKNYTKHINEIIDGYMCGDILGMDNDTEKLFNNPDDLEPLTQEEFINLIKTDDEFAEEWGELGPIYGSQWRGWYTKTLIKTTLKDPLTGNDTYVEGNKAIDQIQNLINELKTNPDSRRLMVSAWNVGELDQMVLPPCHYGFQVYTRELDETERVILMDKKLGVTENLPQYYTEDEMVKHNIPKRSISLMWNQRSVDTFLGLPFNIASYGLLLEIIAKEVNMVPDELVGNLGDVHLYSNHVEQAKEQIGRLYKHEERLELLKEAMGDKPFATAVEELMPFGGGLSEYYDMYKIPYHTKEPFKLPTLKFSDWYMNANEEKHSETVFDDWVLSLKPEDFILENYQSHPTIKAPLSN